MGKDDLPDARSLGLRILLRDARPTKRTSIWDIQQSFELKRPWLLGYGPDSAETMWPWLTMIATETVKTPWYICATLKDARWVHFIPSLPSLVPLERVVAAKGLEVLINWYDPANDRTSLRLYKRGSAVLEFASKGQGGDQLQVQTFQSKNHGKTFLRGCATVADAVGALLRSIEAPEREIKVEEVLGKLSLRDEEGKELSDKALESLAIWYFVPMTAEENPASVKLQRAIERGDAAEAREAIDEGASVEVIPDLLSSPLSLALTARTDGDWKEICRALVKAGARVDGYAWENPPICRCVGELRGEPESQERVELLLGLGADINAQTRVLHVGWTALHRAIERRKFGIVEFLTRRGARLDISNAMGMTAAALLAKGDPPPKQTPSEQLAKLVASQGKSLAEAAGEQQEPPWQALGFTREFMDTMALRTYESRSLFLDEAPQTDGDRIESWAFSMGLNAVEVFAMGSMGYTIALPQLDDWREIGRKVVAASVYYFFGAWRESFTYLGKVLDRERSRAELPWIQLYRSGLALACALGDFAAAERLLKWPAADLKFDDGHDELTRHDNACQIWLASRLRGEPAKASAEQLALIEGGRLQRTKLPVAATLALLDGDAEGFSKALVACLRQHKKHTLDPRFVSSGIAFEATVLWHWARHRGLALSELPRELMMLIPQP